MSLPNKANSTSGRSECKSLWRIVYAEQLLIELKRGGRLIRFIYCISLIVVTIRCISPVYYIPFEGSRFNKSWPYTLMTFFLGWWGIPWGLIHTPRILLTNLGGGEDVTEEIRMQL